jgi:ElaA protein
MSHLHTRSGADLSAVELYGILRLRAAVFVVEQNCPYQDLDDMDLLGETVQLWLTDEDRRVVSCLRVLPENAGRRRIGRVCTAADQRGQGHSTRLMRAALEIAPAARWKLHAQCTVADFYRRFGFEAVGAEFAEDGIPHITMVRDS